MRILSAAGNLPEIRRELKLAEGKPDEFWPSFPTRERQIRGVDFPFLTTCLLLGSGLRSDDYHARPSLDLSIDVPFDGTDNDDGISVFDVTEPGRPRYAMLFLNSDEYEASEDSEDSEGGEGGEGVEELTILSASDYMRRYRRYGDATGIKVSELDSLPLLEAHALKSVWSHGNFKARTESRISSAMENIMETNADEMKHTSSLRALALSNIVRGLFDIDDLSWMDEAEQLQDFTAYLRTYLYAHADAANREMSTSLLARDFSGCAKIDLSPCDGLSLSQVQEFVRSVRTSQKISLVLPKLDELKAQDLRSLLNSAYIAELRISDHEFGDLSDIVNAIDGTGVTRLIASEMYSRRFVDLGDLDKEFEYSDQGLRLKSWSSPLGPLPRPRQFPLVQSIHIHCSPEMPEIWSFHMRETGSFDMPETRLDDGGLQFSRLLKNEGALKEFGHQMPLLSLPLGEYFLSVAESVRILPELLRTLTSPYTLSACIELGRVMMGMMER